MQIGILIYFFWVNIPFSKLNEIKNHDIVHLKCLPNGSTYRFLGIKPRVTLILMYLEECLETWLALLFIRKKRQIPPNPCPGV